jgi:hypothetical protein
MPELKGQKLLGPRQIVPLHDPLPATPGVSVTVGDQRGHRAVVPYDLACQCVDRHDVDAVQ